MSLCVLSWADGPPSETGAAQSAETGTASSAAGSLKDLSLAQLGDVEVTSTTKEPEGIWQTPAAIYVLTHDDIRRSGATSIPEVLRLVPGVEVARINSSTWSVGIRGFGSDFSKSVLVLIDGRSVYTPLFAGVYWDLQNVPLHDVERIEVIRGPGGTIWGSNAVNGVINIITKSSEETRGTYASYTAGNLEQGPGELRYGGTYGDHVSYRTYAMGFGWGPQYHSDGDNYDAWQFGHAGFRADAAISSRDALMLQADVYKGSVGQQVGIGVLSPPAQLNVDGTEDVSGGNILGRWRRDLGSGSDLQVQAYFDRTYRLGPQLGEARNTIDLDFIHHFFLNHRNEIIWGAGARWSPSSVIDVIPTAVFVPKNQSDNLYSTFVQDQIALVPAKLSLTLGSKFEHNIFTGWENEPSARLLWAVSAHQTIWGAVTRAVRTPSRIDEDLQLTGVVASSPPAIFVCVCDNSRFQSETLLGYAAGYRKLVTQSFYLDFALFHNQYNRLEGLGTASVSILPSPPPFSILVSVPFANGIMGSTTGTEISPDWKVNKHVELKATYSYVDLNLEDRVTRTKTSDALSDETSSPRNEGTLQALFTLPRGFDVNSTYRYEGALTGSVPSYTTADTNLSWRFTRDLTFSVVGQNLFQPRHAEMGPLQVQRGAYAQITWNNPKD